MGDPAAIPVLNHTPLSASVRRYITRIDCRKIMKHLRELTSASGLSSSSASTPMKCVGTPCSAVHRSFDTASTMCGGENTGEGYTMAAADDQAARFPSTRRVDKFE